jgi:hypothetical protein
MCRVRWDTQVPPKKHTSNPARGSRAQLSAWVQGLLGNNPLTRKLSIDPEPLQWRDGRAVSDRTSHSHPIHSGFKDIDTRLRTIVSFLVGVCCKHLMRAAWAGLFRNGLT